VSAVQDISAPLAQTPCDAGAYQAGGHTFVIRTTTPALAELMATALRDLRGGTRPIGRAVVYRFAEEHVGGETWWTIAVDDVLITRTQRLDGAAGMLMWHVNQSTIAAAQRAFVVLHAGVVARGGRAVLLPAAMESGKTTLTAALLQRGWDYLSDEAALIHPETLRVQAYPKPLSVDEGSWGVLGALRPPSPSALPTAHTEQWLIPATGIPGVNLATDLPVSAVVAPSYRPERPTVLTPVARRAMLGHAITQSFHVDRRCFLTIAALLRQSQCALLSVRDLDVACDAIEELVRER
jgi:hypothetical protein